MTPIPQTMRALTLTGYSSDIESNFVIDDARPIPKPKHGQVLIKMAASPVNPSDLMFVRGKYGLTKDLPTVPGFEGSGTVVASGGGLLANAYNGRRVACLASDKFDGTYAEYMVTNATRCFPVGKQVSDEQAATALVNPLSALAMFEIAQARNARAIVSTAAAGQLGQMILRIGNQRGIPVINIVRRDEQVTILQALDGKHILNSTDPNFSGTLHALTRQLKATMLFDAVGGALTGEILSAMPRGSHALIYGALSGDPVAISTSQLIFRNQQIEGFWMAAPRRKLSLLRFVRLLIASRATLQGNDLVQSTIRGRYAFDQAAQAMRDYAANMSAGKVLITPNP